MERSGTSLHQSTHIKSFYLSLVNAHRVQAWICCGLKQNMIIHGKYRPSQDAPPGSFWLALVNLLKA
eukprot:1138982-Pelagomonas_calceolata.AAC.4